MIRMFNLIITKKVKELNKEFRQVDKSPLRPEEQTRFGLLLNDYVDGDPEQVLNWVMDERAGESDPPIGFTFSPDDAERTTAAGVLCVFPLLVPKVTSKLKDAKTSRFDASKKERNLYFYDRNGATMSWFVDEELPGIPGPDGRTPKRLWEEWRDRPGQIFIAVGYVKYNEAKVQVAGAPGLDDPVPVAGADGTTPLPSSTSAPKGPIRNLTVRGGTFIVDLDNPIAPTASPPAVAPKHIPGRASR